MNATWYYINSHLTITLTACSEYFTKDQHPPFKSLTQEKRVSHSHTAIQPSTSRQPGPSWMHRPREGGTSSTGGHGWSQWGVRVLGEVVESLLDIRELLLIYLLWRREWGQVLMCQMGGSWGYCATAYSTKRGRRWKWRSCNRKIKEALDAKPLEKQLLSFLPFWIISLSGTSSQSLTSPALVWFFLIHRISVSKAQQLLTFENITLQWNTLYLCLCWKQTCISKSPESTITFQLPKHEFLMRAE